MKKLLGILVCAITLFGCGKSKVKPFELEEKYYGTGSFITVSESSTVKDLEEAKESYVVYVYLSGCTTCASFKPIVLEVIQEKGLIAYEAPIGYLKEAKSVMAKKIKRAPSLALIKEGKLVAYLDNMKGSDAKYYESAEGLASFIDKYIIQK